ncbi:MAG: WD40/YVTN/BNR-like repeat-containing protein [Candidatus Hodarchaeota archaeon]
MYNPSLIAVVSLEYDWTTVISGTTTILESVYFIDSINGWVVGGYGTILRTTNGGEDWVAQTSNTKNWLKDVWFTDSNNGWVVGGYGTILYTSNGGTSWVFQTSGIDDHLQGVYFVNRTHGWAVAYGGAIIVTQNGGQTWENQTSNTIKNLNELYFFNATLGYVVGRDGTILWTINGGEHWQTKNIETSIGLKGITFSKNLGVLVGGFGTIYCSSDYGDNWYLKNTGTSDHLENCEMSPEGMGVVVGDSGTILITEDYGNSWNISSNDINYDLRDVVFLTDEETILIVGDGGVITKGKLKIATTALTTDISEEITILLFGILLITAISIIGFSVVQIANKRRRITTYRPTRISFHCQLDNERHPVSDSGYKCQSCSRMVCASCDQQSAMSGMNNCPYCGGMLVRFQ